MGVAIPDTWFHGFDIAQAPRSLQSALHSADDGELFLENSCGESLLLDEQVIKEASSQTSQGFGLRGIFGETTLCAHSSDLSLPALQRAAQAISYAHKNRTLTGSQQTLNIPLASPSTLVPTLSTITTPAFHDQVSTLQQMDAFARQLHSGVIQASFSLSSGERQVAILTFDGKQACELRSASTLVITLTVEKNGRKERSAIRVGGRYGLKRFLEESFWKPHIEEALRRVLVLLDSVPAPSGEMPVILGHGTPGILLHEAVGHGLEGDANRKGTSVFAHKMGQRVAAPGVTVIDQGNMTDNENAHGTRAIDDEGTPCQRTALIEDGILVGYMFDRLNARLMNQAPTGNGRRQSYSHVPMPRMTNTYMLPGNASLNDMICDIKKGIYAAEFSSGQVDVVSGNFVFAADEAYLIENGKITTPIKGATLIGNGPETMEKIQAVGNDWALGPGPGFCGKNGQTVTVGIGQPSLLISGLTVGGTNV